MPPGPSGKFHAKERAQHGDRVVAPQSSVPQIMSLVPHDPTGMRRYRCIQISTSAKVLFRSRMDLTGTVFPLRQKLPS